MATITVSEGPVKADEAQAFTDAQLPYANLAGSKGIAEKAIDVTKRVMSEWSEKMRPLHRRWKATNYMLMGNTLDRGGPADVHIPELYKMVETITPRVEEAMLERDPWFRVVGRGQIQSESAEVIAAYLDWQLDQCKFRYLFQPTVRDMLVCQVGAVKVLWDRRVTRRFRRKWIQESAGNGKTTYKVTGDWVEEVDYDGPVTKLVDPFDFVIDSKATDPQTALYVGDRCLMTVDEIVRYGEMFGWANLDQVKEAKKPRNVLPDDYQSYRWTRDPTSQVTHDDRHQDTAGRVPQFEVVNLFLKSDILNEEGRFEEVELVIVNGSICCLARQNVTDGQFRPYAIARTAKNGHELYGTGPLDNAVRINQQLDRYHAIFMRAAEISGLPIVFADEDSELPDSLYRLTAGKIIKGAGSDSIKMTAVPDGLVRSAPMILGLLTRNIEETVGAYKIQMGQADTSGTATEATLSLQEGNRRLRALIRSVADMMDQVLHLFHRYNQQFSISKTMFRVLGKRSKLLHREYVEIGPDTLMHDVDFEFIGLKSLNTYGLKAAGLTAFVNSMTPFIQSNPDRVDQLALMHSVATELIGVEEADRILKIPEDTSSMMSQEMENQILLSGAKVRIHEADDDAAHLEQIQPLLEAVLTGQIKDAAVAANITEHAAAHNYARQTKDAQRQALEQRSQTIQSLQGAQAGRAPVAGGFATRASGGVAGENPGPPDARKVARPGTGGSNTSQMETQGE